MKRVRKSIKGDGYRIFRRGFCYFTMGFDEDSNSRQVVGRLHCAVRIGGREVRRSCRTHSLATAHQFALLLRQELARQPLTVSGGGSAQENLKLEI